MKNELSGADIRVLARELSTMLEGAIFDKAYQVGERELVLRFRGRGSLDLVLAPNYVCATRYRRPAPKTPSSFAMQLRKRLGGERVASVSQHGFDRIIEIRFESHILVIELFSKGNIILAGNDWKIIGLLEWQRWKDRTLGVGRIYEHPPGGPEPGNVSEEEFVKSLETSGKSVAATLATKYNLGGRYAEQVCEAAGIDPKEKYDGTAGEAVWKAYGSFMEKVGRPANARIREDDVTPFGGEGEPRDTFNDAVDDYFSKREDADRKDKREAEDTVRRAKISEILAKQEAAYAKATEDAANGKLAGDAIYQHMGELNAAYHIVKEGRRSGLSDDDIIRRLADTGIKAELKGHELTVEL